VVHNATQLVDGTVGTISLSSTILSSDSGSSASNTDNRLLSDGTIADCWWLLLIVEFSFFWFSFIMKRIQNFQ
jgi:hypothetical protein